MTISIQVYHVLAVSQSNEDQATRTATTDQKPAIAIDGRLQKNTWKMEEKKTNLGDTRPESSNGEPVLRASSSHPPKTPLEGGKKHSATSAIIVQAKSQSVTPTDFKNENLDAKENLYTPAES